MIAPKNPQIRQLVRYIGLMLLGLLGWDFVIVVAFKVLHWEWVGSRHVPLALYGSAIGIIVGFRNNSAYARWWDARTLWGQIVNGSRSLARQVCVAMCPNDTQPPGAEKDQKADLLRQIIYYQIAFVHALRQQLRGLDPMAEIRGLTAQEEHPALSQAKNVPLALQKRMATMLREARQRGWIDNWEWQSIDRNLDNLTSAQGGAERIKNTPMPKQYDFFPKLFVQIYCLMLPVGMVENLGWITPVGSTLVGFMFLALEEIGRDLEDPFDNTIYDVPITAISKTIEINLRQMLGETELPEPEKPVHGVLW
jgi:ion channel-forming bestrophin family protein